LPSPGGRSRDAGQPMGWPASLNLRMISLNLLG
jgi:hypothetical protein